MKKEFLDLGRQPIANRFLTEDQTEDEFFYDLKMGWDDETFLVSQMEFVNPTDMFNKDYVYHSSGTETMRNHFQEIALWLKENFAPKKVMEIGSNDGVFVKHFDKENTVAVEPCGNFAEITNNLGYQTYNDFWNYDTSDKILNTHGKQDLIYSANCMCHIHDIEQAFLAVENILSDDGVFVFEDPSLIDMLLKGSYDQFYDEHAHIFSITALKNIFKKTNLEIFGVDRVTHIHGGSNRIYVKHKGKRDELTNFDNLKEVVTLEESLNMGDFEVYKYFASKARNSIQVLAGILWTAKRLHGKLVGYGATSKSTTVYNACGINNDIIDYIVDTTPAKQGKLSPGVHIPVVSYEEGWTSDIEAAYVGAWNYLDVITAKETDFLERGGIFFTHIPEPRAITEPTCGECLDDDEFWDDETEALEGDSGDDM